MNNENTSDSSTVYPIEWTIDRVEDKEAEDGYYLMLNECGEDCHHPIHAFHPERRKHLIASDLVKIARKNNWWSD